MTPSNLVKEYRAHVGVNLPKPRAFELVSPDLNTIKNDISTLLNGGVNFDTTHGSTILVFHTTYGNGKTPIGWITTYEIPEPMCIGTLVDQRLQAA